MYFIILLLLPHSRRGARLIYQDTPRFEGRRSVTSFGGGCGSDKKTRRTIYRSSWRLLATFMIPRKYTLTSYFAKCNYQSSLKILEQVDAWTFNYSKQRVVYVDKISYLFFFLFHAYWNFCIKDFSVRWLKKKKVLFKINTFVSEQRYQPCNNGFCFKIFGTKL